jgi:hypothetical protein
MNYFLMIIIIGMAGFAYYQHNQDEQQVTSLQQQISDLQDKAKSTAATQTTAIVHPAPTPMPVVQVVAPEAHSSAIDEAAHAATTAATSNSNNLGSITTLDGRTFQNCKVLKVESDGVTFSHDEGITKILYPFLPPSLQKQFGYDPQQAAANADAEVRYASQQAAAEATTNAPTTTAAPQ